MMEFKLHPIEKEHSVYLSISPSGDEPDCFSGSAKEIYSNEVNSFYRVEPNIERLINLLQALRDKGYDVEEGHINLNNLRVETEDEFLSRIEKHVKFCRGMISQSKKNKEAIELKLERIEKGLEEYEHTIKVIEEWKETSKGRQGDLG